MALDPTIELNADTLMKKTKHYLITMMGRTSDEANDEEIYRALSYALREEVMINWLATLQTYTKFNSRILFYLSMEYMPGRIFTNNITNLKSRQVIALTLQKLGRNLSEIIDKENDPGLGNGGLGRLASCFLDSLATLNLPARAYGLRYQYGIFEQQLWDGMQIEAPDTWLISENPWEFRRDLRKLTVKYSGKVTSVNNIHNEEVQNLTDAEEVWALPYDIPIVGYAKTPDFSVSTLRLWTTKESPRNFQIQSYNAGRLDQAAENTILTDVLYPSDHHETGKRIRLKQEFLLVSASVQDIIRHYLTSHDNFREFADKVRIQINDTHPALTVAELIRILTKRFDIPWKTALDITQQVLGYTNHTILSEALEQWDLGLMNYLLPRQTKIIERINQDFCTDIRKKYPDDEEKIRRMSIIEKGRVRMANLSIVGAHKVNGVAKLHSDILKQSVFKDFAEYYPEKFVNITNGVTQRRWLLDANPELSSFISQKIGDGWITDYEEIAKFAAFADDENARLEIMQIKRNNKFRLMEFLQKDNRIRNARGEVTDSFPLIDIDSIFDVQTKRIHEYKRQLMNAINMIMIYQDMLENPHSRHKRTSIVGGKAAAGYEAAKDIIRLICAIARKVNSDPRIGHQFKIVYVENYNVSKAELIIPGADLSEQISTAGTEASGTGNMKFAMNGALTIGTDDGANIEMREMVGDQWWPFKFGASTQEINQLRDSNAYSPKAIYESNAKIRKALDALTDRTFAINDTEHQIFSDILHKLLEGHYGAAPDRYFILHDLQSYYDTQLKVELLYENPEEWAKYVIMNIAGTRFSSDTSVLRYSELVWGLTRTPPDPTILEKIKYEYSLVDQCRIL